MSEVKEIKKVDIPPYARIKVYWDDRPENYTRDGRNRVKSHFSKKYGVAKNNINVVFRPVKVNKKGDVVEITGADIENIMDINYQRQLMKEWLEREDIQIDFERLAKLDDKVNSELNITTSDVRHRRWYIRWIKIDNFLCFGEDNYFNFGKYKGLNVVMSNPLNQGGKTTFSVDTLKFLLFGKTTKTDKNEQIFNQFTNKNRLEVRGMISFDDNDIIIERIMTRTEKRGGGWNIKNQLNYYKLMPDGEEIPLEEEHATATTEEIKNTIGDESDFDITILATANNLEDLIDSTPTQSGKLLTKFIGLELIEKKEEVARKMYNEFSKKMKANLYNIVSLQSEILEHKEKIEQYKEILKSRQSWLEEIKAKIIDLNKSKDVKLQSKKVIDVTISQLNPTTIESEITKITAKGVEFKNKIAEYEKEINEIGNIDFNEDKHYDLIKEQSKLEAENSNRVLSIHKLEAEVEQLKNGELCPSCGRPLEDVDHSKEIAEKEAIIEAQKKEIELVKRKIEKLNTEISKMAEAKSKYDKKNKLELERDRAEVEIGSLRNKIKDKKADLKKYKDNEDAINHNIAIDAEIEIIKTKIGECDYDKDRTIRNIQIAEDTIKSNESDIEEKEALIKTIQKEEEVDKIFKIYIDMVGKKGISKLVLRSVLPIINSEIYRLLEDVCDFEVELNINNKNEVEFMILKDEIEKPLKSGSGFEKTVSSLALRCVLGKMSHLPMPNFVTFDEVWGKVADDNIIKMKPMFDKIKDMFDIVFLITHNDLVKDWADHIITITKNDNISKIATK